MLMPSDWFSAGQNQILFVAGTLLGTLPVVGWPDVVEDPAGNDALGMESVCCGDL